MKLRGMALREIAKQRFQYGMSFNLCGLLCCHLNAGVAYQKDVVRFRISMNRESHVRRQIDQHSDGRAWR